MNAHAVKWLLFLALIRNSHHNTYFEVVSRFLTAKEGSCVTIECRVQGSVSSDGAKWFWMKDAIWNENNRTFNATYIYSTDTDRPVSLDIKARVTYVGPEPSDWNTGYYSRKCCSILICDLKKTDSGDYKFRFIGSNKWVTQEPAKLTVTENPCLITFSTPPAVHESETITLNCSTLLSCSTHLEYKGLNALSQTQHQTVNVTEEKKIYWVTFPANWEDDGKEISCQESGNTDSYLTKKINISVKYAPKNLVAKTSPQIIREGNKVTLTCSASGNPEPRYTWFKNEKPLSSGAQLEIPSIRADQNGSYSCKAENDHGRGSAMVNVDVTYVPEIEIRKTSPASEIREGDEITLTCHVTRSNPPPRTYYWYKDDMLINRGRASRYSRIMEPGDSGSYKCEAENSAGCTTSQPHEIRVLYIPRKPSISGPREVKFGYSLTITCDTSANPEPTMYSWYGYSRDKPADSSAWVSRTMAEKDLHLGRVQTRDEICYTCNATNTIGTGEKSEARCIQVVYSPTNVQLHMEREVREGRLVTFSCTAESSPPSKLTLIFTRLGSQYSEELPQPSVYQPPNVLNYTFNATWAHNGDYRCRASNSQGFSQTTPMPLVVRYRPVDVTISPQSELIEKENSGLTLHCSAKSDSATTFTWWKITGGGSKFIHRGIKLVLSPLHPSDSGLYRCSATNDIGTGNSSIAEVKVKYGPKQTDVLMAAEQQLPERDGRRSVMLSCSSRSYPPINQYWWFMKTSYKDPGTSVSGSQNHTVYSDSPGYYYCVAKNEIGQKSSVPVSLFVERTFIKALKFGSLFLVILLVIVFFFVFYRRRRNKPVHANRNSTSFLGFLATGNGGRTRMNEPAEASCSRDDLLPEQPCNPKAQRRQCPPDVAPASNINTVYCTVNLPATKLGPSAQKTNRQDGGKTEVESLNYASLHFDKKKKTEQPQAGDNAVYAKVANRKEKAKQENADVYENVGAAQVVVPDLWVSESDTSDEEVELNYTRVSFKLKEGRQRASRHSSDSSDSDREDTQYSEVKI